MLSLCTIPYGMNLRGAFVARSAADLRILTDLYDTRSLSEKHKDNRNFTDPCVPQVLVSPSTFSLWTPSGCPSGYLTRYVYMCRISLVKVDKTYKVFRGL